MTTPPRFISQLGYLGFEVSSLAAWDRFATEVLGLAVLPGPVPASRWLRMDDHAQRFVLLEGPADDLVFTGWQVAHAADLQAFSAHLDAQGIAWAWGSEAEHALRGVQRLLHFHDPVGNRHEVYLGPQLATTRFTSPRVASGFVTGDEGLGHVVFGSPQYADSVAFAQRVLGLGLSDTIALKLGQGLRFEVSFCHANARHHSYAVAPNPPSPGPHKRIHHFMLEVKAVEEVGFARDRCLAAGQGVTMDLGQHPNDRMISFYGQTPSGFHVEFGWGGVKVDEARWQVVQYDRLSEWGHRPSTEGPPRAATPPQGTDAPQPQEKTMSIAGQWNVVIKTPLGNNEVVFDLEVEGDELMGAIRGPKETNEIYDGKVDGATLSWGSKVSQPIPMDIEFTATIDGDTISGGAKSPFGTAPFTGRRA